MPFFTFLYSLYTPLELNVSLPPPTRSNAPYTTLGKRVLVQHFTPSTGERSEFGQLFCLLSPFIPISLHLWKGISAHPSHPFLLYHWGLGLCSASTLPLSLHQREGGRVGGGRKMMRKFGVTFFLPKQSSYETSG